MNPRTTVLVVNDDAEMGIFLSNLLEGSGFVPVAASAGPDGLAMARKVLPGLIILEGMMLGSDFAQFYHDLRTDRSLGRIPVIIISPLEPGTYIRFQKTQQKWFWPVFPEPDAFLSKPPEAEELLCLVERLTRGRKEKA